MGSINAENAAKEVIGKIENGEKVVLGEILENLGYAETVVKNPKNVTETKSFQKEMNPFIEKMIKERERIIEAMAIKDLNEVQYSHLTEAVDKLTKNIQLLSGGDTDRSKILILPSEIIEKNS